MAAAITRQSPVQLKAGPLKTEARDHWTVVRAYNDEGDGPWLADLSHKTRWDLQDRELSTMTVGDQPIPETPGGSTLAVPLLINRMNGTQTSVFHLGAGAGPDMPAHSGYTDVTEAALCVALFGPRAFRVAEKLTNLDFMAPAKEAPFLLQGLFCHVPCQIVTLEKRADGAGGFLITCSRGYGDSMIGAILKAGEEFGLRPAGEDRFQGWVENL